MTFVLSPFENGLYLRGLEDDLLIDGFESLYLGCEC